ncbi:LytR/AlgR family response regulator transcription factor [Flavobacterium nackdongense]|uniref:LytR/AlgR family response regulator transcription factor n=1 Tax=Flavobacterium nackdongense TaxID=2547394 RepID=UPI001D1319AB|nr:LytTR family DNA-binding domain-containing protein [Flavobacterium nackdongense]
MNFPYIIIDDNQESVLKTKAIADGFSELVFVASANNYADGLHLILEHNPKLIFLEIDPADTSTNLSLALINELYRYLKVVPKVIITTSKKELAFDAIQYEVADYLIKPVQRIDFIKFILKIKKTVDEEPSSFVVEKQIFNEPTVPKPELPLNNFEEDKQEETAPIPEETTALETSTFEEPADLETTNSPDEESSSEEDTILHIPKQRLVPISEQPLILCIKSYGDYRYIDARDICYFQADNNSTDIHLNTGEMVTAFKTLKHFEGILSAPFARIHNSYIVNSSYISRIHTGNAVCYIKNTTTKIPFSKSYKENIDAIISDFANGNYLEI